MAMSLYMLGNAEAAAQEIAQEPLYWMRHTGTAIVQKKLGNDEEAEAAMAMLIEEARDNGLYQQAQVHAQWGDIETSMKELNRARDIGDPGVSQIVTDPLLDPLRGEPDFAKLMADVGYG
jgi:citrate lyase beta subunit